MKIGIEEETDDDGVGGEQNNNDEDDGGKTGDDVKNLDGKVLGGSINKTKDDDDDDKKGHLKHCSNIGVGGGGREHMLELGR